MFWRTTCRSTNDNPGVDYFGPFPTAPWGNSYTLLFADRFSQRTGMYTVSAAEFTAEETVNTGIPAHPSVVVPNQPSIH